MIRTIAIGIVAALGGLLTIATIAVGALYVVHGGDRSVLPTTEHDPSLPHLELDGYRFHAETFGSSPDPVVIVLHGGPGGDYRYILPLAALAEDGYRVVFYDQRGSGLSPRVPTDQLTLERFIADLDSFVDHFSPEEPVRIVGHSWGAMLASAYIGRYPDKVDHAVLAEPGFLENGDMERFYAVTGLKNMKPSVGIMAAMTTAWAESLHVRGPDSQARRDYMMNAFQTTPMKEHPLAGYYPDRRLENAAGESWRYGAAASVAVPESGMDADGKLVDLAAGVEDWKGPALFLSGSENVITGPAYQRKLMNRFPNAHLVVIEGAGHTMIGEKPEESLEAIREFLAQP